jgi:hypothetical protein
MLWHYRGRDIPLEVYHGVPKGWYADDILAEHARLGGTYDLDGPEATEPGAPGWLPERHAWLQYREMLRRIADGVRAGDAACVELAVRYIELRYIGSYSGHLRSLLSRSLKHASLTDEQKTRLHAHFSDLVIREERTHEFREYLRLWRTILTKTQLERFLRELEDSPNGDARAQWLLERLRLDETQDSVGNTLEI